MVFRDFYVFPVRLTPNRYLRALYSFHPHPQDKVGRKPVASLVNRCPVSNLLYQCPRFRETRLLCAFIFEKRNRPTSYVDPQVQIGFHTTLIHRLDLQQGILGLIIDLVSPPNEVTRVIGLTANLPKQATYEKEPESVKATPELVCSSNAFSRRPRRPNAFVLIRRSTVNHQPIRGYTLRALSPRLSGCPGERIRRYDLVHRARS